MLYRLACATFIYLLLQTHRIKDVDPFVSFRLHKFAIQKQFRCRLKCDSTAKQMQCKQETTNSETFDLTTIVLLVSYQKNYTKKQQNLQP